MAAPTITITSDLGTSDAALAIAKGILLQHLPDACIVDISHEARPYALQEVAYIFQTGYPHFQSGCYHVILSDLFYGPDAALAICHSKGSFFMAPNNGVLPMAVNDTRRSWLLPAQGFSFVQWVHLIAATIQRLEKNPGISATFHAAVLQKETTDGLSQDVSSARLIHIDPYGNVVFDMTKERFSTLTATGRFTIKVQHGEEINQIDTSIRSVRAGYRFARFNNAGFLEIGVRNGSAAALLGLGYQQNQNSITIQFNDRQDSKNEFF